MNSLDHITLRVQNLARAKTFYQRVLGVLGMNVVLGSAREGFWGFGFKHDPVFEIAQATGKRAAHNGVHIAFRAGSKKTVDAFYQAALKAGAHDNGAPGPRPQYTPSYYAAFVFDADGNNIEVCRY